MLRLHYVPGGHGSPVCPKRSTLWDFGHFFSVFKFCEVLLSFITVYHGIRDGPWGKGAVESRRLKVLIKVWRVFHVLSRLSTDETWTPGSFGARLCPRYKKKGSQAGFCCRKSMGSSFSSSEKLVTTLEASWPVLLAGESSSASSASGSSLGTGSAACSSTLLFIWQRWTVRIIRLVLLLYGGGGGCRTGGGGALYVLVA